MATELTQIEVAETTLGLKAPAAGRHDASEAQPTAPPEVPSEMQLSRQTVLRIASAGYSFFVAGVNDGSLGTIIPYLIQAYGINTGIVSSVYGAAFLGWFLAAISNTHLSQYLDLGAMLVLGCCLQILGSVLRTWVPPFGLYIVTFFFISLGQAFQDTHANTYVAGAKTPHRWLGFIHAMYTAGCLVAPFIANSVAAAHTPSLWNLFYIVPTVLGLLNLVAVVVAFRDTIVIKRRRVRAPAEGELGSPTAEDQNLSRSAGAANLVKGTLRMPAVWLLSLFFFFYLGTALTAGGWVVQYLVDVRGGDLAQMGYVPAGISGGACLGRLFLPDVIHRFGERRMVLALCLLGLGMQLCFWLIPSIVAASITMTIFGFVTGPFFPTAMSLGSRLFPPEFHPTALAFVFVVAQIGGSIFPIVTGVIASHSGVAVLQPILTGLLVATAISWLLVPSPKTLNNAALHHE